MIFCSKETSDHLPEVTYVSVWGLDSPLRRAGLFSEIWPGKFLPNSLQQLCASLTFDYTAPPYPYSMSAVCYVTFSKYK